MITDEDILLKKFKNAGFARSGYDKDDVDDFLDEVAETVRELNKRNIALEQSKGIVPESEIISRMKSEKETLQQKIYGLEKDIENLSSKYDGDKKDNNKENELSKEISEKDEKIKTLEENILTLENELKKQSNTPKEVSKEELSESKENNVESATNMLSLAQKLHDEYINNAKDEANKILSDADNKAKKTVSDAEYKSSSLVSNAEETANAFAEKVKKEKIENEQKKKEVLSSIDTLKLFETDYRKRLKEQLESILSNIKNNFE